MTDPALAGVRCYSKMGALFVPRVVLCLGCFAGAGAFLISAHSGLASSDGRGASDALLGAGVGAGRCRLAAGARARRLASSFSACRPFSALAFAPLGSLLAARGEDGGAGGDALGVTPAG